MLDDPEAFAPSDVTLDCEGVQTNHISKVILREKVIIVGDSSVKTALVQSIRNYEESEFGYFKVAHFPIADSNVTVDLFIYESSGSSILTHEKSLFRNSSFVVGGFDISSDKSLKNIEKFHLDIQAWSGEELLPIFLCVFTNTSTELHDAICFAKDHSMTYFECMVDSTSDLLVPFQFIAEESFKQYCLALRKE